MTTRTAPEADANGVMRAPRRDLHATPGAQAVSVAWTEEGTPVSLAACETVSEKARAYERWLARESLRAETVARQGPRSSASLDGYALRAGEEIVAGSRRFRPFAPYQPAYSALRTFTRGQLIALGALALGLLAALALWGAQTLVALLGALTGFYLFDLALTAAITTRTLRRNPTVVIDDDVARAVRDGFWPSYTILCPLYHEAEVAEQFARAMRLIDYPTDRLQVLFLTEEDDVETREALLKMRLPRHFEVVTVPDGEPRTKPRACNYGLMRATGDFVVIFDAEDIPDPLQLKKAVLTFAHHGPELACVQASLNFYNPRQNALTRWFTAEYSLWFDLTLPALRRTRSFLPLGGTSNHFRTRILREVGGWDPFNVTEDCDLGVRLAQYRYQIAMVDSTTYEEANPDLKNWLRQRSRWIKGYMQTYLTHMRNPLRYAREGRLSELFWLQVIVGGRTLTQLVNPLLWLMTLAYVVFHQELAAPYHLLYLAPLFYPAVFCLVFGNLFYIYMYVIGCLNREQYTLTLWALLVPLYWLLMSVAAYIALYQLLTRPHYWEKTRHGLSLLALKSGWMEAILPLGDLAPALEVARALGNDLINLAEFMESALAHALEGNARIPGLVADLARGPLAGMIIYLNDELARARRDARMNGAREARVAPSLALPVAPVVDMLSTMTMPAVAPALAAQSSLAAIPAIRPPAPACEIAPTPRASTEDAPRATNARDAGASASRGLVGAWRAVLPAWLAWMRDGWLVATLLTAITASMTACVYFFSQHQILLYTDAEAHMTIARRVFDSSTPGLAQLGSNWLPLPHVLMWPFVWNDYLWRMGLAGTLVAAPCYVVTAMFVFLAARKLTGHAGAAYIGALVFILNPNVLYLQATPLSEAVLLMVMAMASYFFIKWSSTGRIQHLLLTAGSAFLCIITRYDGWTFFIAVATLIAIVGIIKRYSMRKIFGDLMLFSVPNAAMISLWFLWNALLTGSPLYFQNGPFSPQSQQRALRAQGWLPTFHNPALDFLTYGLAVVQFAGPVIVLMGVAAVLRFVILRPAGGLRAITSLVYLAPALLYLFSLYSGQIVIYTPDLQSQGLPGDLFNVRYAALMILPLSIFIATLISQRWFAHLLAVALIVAQIAFTSMGGIITLQEGEYGISCISLQPTDIFLLEHYNGGKVLVDSFNDTHNFATLGIDLHSVIYEGSYQLWGKALADPARYVDWIIMAPHDLVAQKIDVTSGRFTAAFILVARDSSGVQIYYRRDAPELPVRSVPASLMLAHASCHNGISTSSPAPASPSPSPSSLPQQQGPHASIISPALMALATPARPVIALSEEARA